MKKYIGITNLVFELPEDFDGTVTEALEEIIKYRKSPKAKKNRKTDKDGSKICKSLSEALEYLLECEGDKLHLEVSMFNIDDSNNVGNPFIDDEHLN